MTLGSMLRLFSLPVAVAITAIGFSGLAVAADQPGAAPLGAAPTMLAGPGSVGGAGCATCGTASAGCNTCNAHKSLLHHHKTCTPYQTTLCPGACFGYFQTQWHRWENVCPIPYQGAGLSDAPVRASPAVTAPTLAPKTGSDVPLPKALPTIPVPPSK